MGYRELHLSTRPAALEVRDLHAAYGRTPILDRIDLTIGCGEIFGLLGRNGAGKTTLVRAICGRLRPLRGEIRVAGKAGARDRIGLVPQEIALYPHLTIRENLQLFGRLSGLSRRDTDLALDDVVRATGLEHRRSERVATLSGGWKRRVNLAAALLHRPDLLILDEPMAGIDLEARRQLDAVIRALQQTGMGILLITHDLAEAESLCSRVGFLQNGILAPQGAPRDLLQAAFGTRVEMILDFRTDLSEADRQALTRLGFRPSHDDQWTLTAEDPASTLPAELTRAGIAPAEMRFRRPGLESLFRDLPNPRQPASEEAAR